MNTSAPLRAAAVLLGVAVMWARRPEFFSEPRFWAEEGTVFFARAWSLPWWRMLPAAPLDYLSLYTNVAVTMAATAVPLERAPLVTTIAALLVQTAPLVLLAVAVAPEWQHWRRYVAMAVVLFASLSDEVWLTTLHSHYYFALVAFLILLEPGDVGRGRAAAYAGLTGLAGLAGPVPCFLFPLFAIKACRSRRPADLWQAAALAAAVVVQVTIVLGRELSVEEVLARSPTVSPGSTVDVAVFACVVWMKMIVLPLLGMNAADALAGPCQRLALGDDAVASTVLAALSLVPLALALAWLTGGLPRRLRLPLAGSLVLIATLTVVLSFGNKAALLRISLHSSRYAYVPGVLLLMLLLHGVRSAPGERPDRRAVVSAVLLAVALIGGVARYPATVRVLPIWPAWRDEVAAWRDDPARPIRLWPDTFSIRLRPRVDERPRRR